MKTVILINGKKRSGKDFTATKILNELKSRGYEVDIMSFAKPMKELISKTFGITEDELDLYKNSEDYGIEIKVYPNNQPSCTLKYITFREILQLFGTEAMKPIFGNDIWAKLLYNKTITSEADFILIPDFRFKVEHLNSPDIITLKIKNSDYDNSTDLHLSETELDDFTFDYTIDNSGYRDTTKDIKLFCDILYKQRIKNENIS